MDKFQFAVPVRIIPEAGQPVTEIYSVDDALTFLHYWPARRQGPVFQTALNCCFGAKVGQVSTEDARKSFVGFARITGISAQDMAPKVMVGMDGEVRPLPG